MKKIKISLDGQSKAVVASVEIESDTTDGEEIIKEIKKLYELADTYAVQKTIQKMR
jgi:uncharacterized protein YxjI